MPQLGELAAAPEESMQQWVTLDDLRGSRRGFARLACCCRRRRRRRGLDNLLVCVTK